MICITRETKKNRIYLGARGRRSLNSDELTEKMQKIAVNKTNSLFNLRPVKVLYNSKLIDQRKTTDQLKCETGSGGKQWISRLPFFACFIWILVSYGIIGVHLSVLSVNLAWSGPLWAVGIGDTDREE